MALSAPKSVVFKSQEDKAGQGRYNYGRDMRSFEEHRCLSGDRQYELRASLASKGPRTIHPSGSIISISRYSYGSMIWPSMARKTDIIPLQTMAKRGFKTLEPYGYLRAWYHSPTYLPSDDRMKHVASLSHTENNHANWRPLLRSTHLSGNCSSFLCHHPKGVRCCPRTQQFP